MQWVPQRLLDAPLAHYQCHVGHSFSADSLLEAEELAKSSIDKAEAEALASTGNESIQQESGGNGRGRAQQ